MEQYAHLIAARLAGAALVADPAEIAEAIAARRVPVLAPYRWLRAADPLPHSWDVTSDSIAAWVSGFVRARRLVLVKPSAIRLDRSCPAATDEAAPDALPGDGLLDASFDRALPNHVTAVIVPADDLNRLRAALQHGKARVCGEIHIRSIRPQRCSEPGELSTFGLHARATMSSAPATGRLCSCSSSASSRSRTAVQMWLAPSIVRSPDLADSCERRRR